MQWFDVGGWDDERRRQAAIGGLTALAFIVLVFVIYPAPMPILFLGLITGSLSGLIAIGLVLVYRANRIVNFAQGSMGAIAAVMAASLIVGPDISYFPAVLIGLAVALGLGAVTEILFIRRFAKSPRLVLTVATVGVAQVLDAAGLIIPDKLFNLDDIPQPPQPFTWTVNWHPIVFRGGHFLVLMVVPVVTAGLYLFFQRTRIGIAVRASAESADRAALLGIPVKRINTVVWVIAAGLSATGVLLRLPIGGLSLGQPVGVSLLTRALAAAVISRMEKLPRTLVAALALGVIEQAVLFETGKTIVVDAVLFAVILVALVVQHGGAERARELASAAWSQVGQVRPVPKELRSLPEIRGGTIAIGAVAAAFLLFLPMLWTQSRVNLFGVGLVFAMLCCSLVVLTGWAGQISLGQLSIGAMGMCVAGTLFQQGKNFFLCIAIAGVVGAAIAVAIGVPALRIRGPFLAVTTLAFAQATGSFIVNEEYFDWLVPDIRREVIRPVIFDKFDLESEYTYYFVLLFALALVIAIVWRLRTSRTGRTIIAIRDNPAAGQSYGISAQRAQLTAFAISGWIAATAGGLFWFHQRGLAETWLEPETSVTLFVIAVTGGLGSLPGAFLGAGYLTFVDYSPFTRQDLSRLAASGIGVLLILLFLPGGLGGALYRIRDSVLRFVARRRDIPVPSLLEDKAADEPLPAEDVAAKLTEPSDDPMLVVRGLDVSYGRAQVLFGVDLHVERGEVLALLGTNGAGKSTILATICGLVRPDSGAVTFDRRDITGHSPQALVASGIVLMPGGKAVFPTLNVAENLLLAGWPWQRSDPQHVESAIERVLSTFPVLRERLDQKAGNLSGGEQQMLALGQALVAKPELLLIDELSLGLAPIVVGQLLDIVKAINDAGTSIVIVEQSVNIAASLAHRAVFLEKGEVRFDGPIAELLERGDILHAVFLGSQKRKVPAVPTGNGHRHQFVPVCETCGHEHGVALAVESVTVNFGGIRAVDDVSFEVRAGEVFGLIGPNGAGKTTILDVISGFVTPLNGSVSLGETDVTDLPADVRAWKGLGRSFQDARLFPSLTVREAIAVALERHIEVRDPMAAFVLSPSVKLSERKVDQRVDELIEVLQLEAYAGKFLGELSTGTRRVVDLACVLAHRPSVLLLDEPGAGIAQREVEALAPLLLDIRDRTGAAIVIIEHDMPLIAAVSDELVALESGAEVARGLPDDVLSNPRVVAGYLGGSEAAFARSGSRPRKKRRPARIAQ